MKNNDKISQLIKDESERILELIRGATVYGSSIDMDNWRMVIVAAYYVGWLQAQDASLKALNNAFDKLK